MQQHKRNRMLPMVLVLSISLSLCSASDSGTFAEWLSSKTGGAIAALKFDGAQDYSGPREYVHQCLRHTSLRNCRNMSGAFYSESGATCCDARSHSGNSMGNANIEVGNCKFTELYFAGDDETAVVHEAPGVTKWGEFTAQCYLNAASDSCGHPFCDQMVLEASGGIYLAEDIVLASRPMDPTYDASCGGNEDKRSSKFGRFIGRRTSRKGQRKPAAESSTKVEDKSGVKIASAEPAYKSKEPNLYSGAAVIYFGPMTINSRAHDVSISSGWFEYTWDYAEDGPISKFDAEGKHVVNPFTFSFKLYKQGLGSY